MKKLHTVSLIKPAEVTHLLKDGLNKLIEQVGEDCEKATCNNIREACITGEVAIVEKKSQIIGMAWLWPLQRPSHEEAEILSLIHI